MNVLYITPTFFPATYWGGPIYSVYGLCNALAERFDKFHLRVLTSDSAGPKINQRVIYDSVPVHYDAGYDVYFHRRWLGHSFSPGMLLRLWPMIRWADVVHLTAVYSSPTIPTLLICRLLGKSVVWSPRGALQRWEGTTRPLLKRAWEWACNWFIKPGRCVLHVTSQDEATDSVKRIPKGFAQLIPNAVDFPELLPARAWLPEGQLRLLFIGRLHPIKGIENLLHAIKLLGNTSYSLAIYGSGDEAYTLSLHQLVRGLGLGHSVSFHGHVSGEQKIKAFMQADLCVVPSSTENYGMVVAEALAHGVPVIASKGTPWKEIETYGCGFWVENTLESLADVIDNIDRGSLSVMGTRGREWIEKEFNWTVVGSQMHHVYETLINKSL